MKHKYKILALVLIATGAISFFFLGEGVTKQAVSKEPEKIEQTSKTASENNSPWSVRCNKDEQGNAAGCEVFQRITVKESGQRVIEFAIGYPQGKEKPAKGVIILPLGVLLPAGVKMQIDDQEKIFAFNIRSCVPVGCVSHVNLSQEVLDLLKKGVVANIQFVADNGQNVVIKISLKGFTKALSSI